MVEIQNSKITDRLLEETKAQPYMELPKKIADSIQPVLIANPRPRIFHLDQNLSDGTSIAILTVSSVKDTYLLSAHLSVAKDAVGASLFSDIQVVAKGAGNKSILRIRYQPLTAASNLNASMSWAAHPLKLERGSLILLTNSVGTASIDASAQIVLMEVDSTPDLTG